MLINLLKITLFSVLCSAIKENLQMNLFNWNKKHRGKKNNNNAGDWFLCVIYHFITLKMEIFIPFIIYKFTKKNYLQFSVKGFHINFIPWSNCCEIEVEASGKKYNLIMPLISGRAIQLSKIILTFSPPFWKVLI